MKNPLNTHAARANSYFFNSISCYIRTTLLAAMALAASGGVQAQTPYLSEMRAFAFGYCPKGWALADGATLPITQNQALYALMGTTYGGNGQSTFGLPDLRGRMPVGQGVAQGVGYSLGQRGGAEATTITIAQMPTHTHALIATTAPATHATPTAGAMLAQTQNAGLYTAGPADTTLTMLGSTGGGQPVSTRDPHLAITWCVALSGVLPSAN